MKSVNETGLSSDEIEKIRRENTAIKAATNG